MHVQRSITKAKRKRKRQNFVMSVTMDNGYLDCLLHQNVFLCGSKILHYLEKPKDLHLGNYLKVHSPSLLLNLVTRKGLY